MRPQHQAASVLRYFTLALINVSWLIDIFFQRMSHTMLKFFSIISLCVISVMNLEQERGVFSPRTPQQVSQTLTTVTVNCLFPRRQVTDPESCMMQWGGWKARGLETWVLVLTLPPDGCGKNHLTCWCQVCQDMVIRNSEIMSGKPFELLRSKRVCKHKVLLLPSLH